MPTTPNPSDYIKGPNGLLIPPGYRNANSEMAQRQSELTGRSFREPYGRACSDGFAYGLRLDRDPDTLVIRWAPKGSGLDDLINQALADGEIGNVGISPIVFSQLNGLIKRRQNQALSTSIVVTGRSFPTNRASSAISRWNDSPLGAVDAVRKIIYQLDTYNRGAPIATVPLWLPVEQWEQEGLYLHPLANPSTDGHNQSSQSHNQANQGQWLEVDWNVRKTAVPYLPSVFDLEPTGLPEWPYWFKKEIDGAEQWILLHQSQIVSLLNSRTGTAGIGTSAVYICLGFLGEHALAIDERYESMIDAPGEGIVTISGTVQGAQQIRTAIEGEGATKTAGHDWTLLASPNELKVGMYRWRQWDSVQFKDRQEHFEDILALAFDEPLSSVVIRGGIGYGTQAHDAGNNVAEGGVFAVLKALELVLGTIYPRVSISVTKTNDRARSLALDLLDRFATAVAKLPIGTLSIAEIRAYIDRDLLTIPSTNADIVQDDARAGTGAPSGPENDEQPQNNTSAEAELVNRKSSDLLVGLIPNEADPYGALELVNESDALLAWIIATLPDAELAAMIAEANQVVAAIRFTNHIENLITESAALANWLNP